MVRATNREYRTSDLRDAACHMDEDDNLWVRDLLAWAACKIDDQQDEIDGMHQWRERLAIVADEIG